MTASLHGDVRGGQPIAGRVAAGEALHARNFDACQELCRDHGEDPRDVAWVEHDVIDVPLLRFGIYLVNDEGRRYAEADGRMALTTREHLLSGDLPPWWPTDTEGTR